MCAYHVFFLGNPDCPNCYGWNMMTEDMGEVNESPLFEWSNRCLKILFPGLYIFFDAKTTHSTPE